MDKLGRQISRGIVTGFLLCFLLWLIAEILLPAGTPKTRAMIIRTHTEERIMSTMLEDQAMKVGGLTNINGQFVFAVLFADSNQSLFRTNASGEVSDIWQIPYRIELVAPTNFIIRSAGKGKTFGDADDIIFNSVSNDFVKP